MSRTLDAIWRSNRNPVEKAARTGYAGLGKIIQSFNGGVAHTMYEQANPDIDQDKNALF